MLYNVLTWVENEGELYVLIIIIHGMFRNFVNMKLMLELDVWNVGCICMSMCAHIVLILYVAWYK